MKTIDKIIEHSIDIKKSTFICTLIPCSNIADIDDIISYYKSKYHDANHNCVAYIVASQKRANDDGEPSKTAGMPMLNVLEKQELSNIIAIVTRYFGGIKLGAGGLTRAYTQSVVEALNVAQIVSMEPIDCFEITINYNHSKKFEHLCKLHEIIIENIQYTDQVSYRILIKDHHFFNIIQELTNNQYQKQFLYETTIAIS